MDSVTRHHRSLEETRTGAVGHKGIAFTTDEHRTREAQETGHPPPPPQKIILLSPILQVGKQGSERSDLP